MGVTNNNAKCACGCGNSLPSPRKKGRDGGYVKFLPNHWWNLPEYKKKIVSSNKKRKKEVPDIQPSTGRRMRGSKYWSRVLMENHLNRVLLSTEHVHHINGDETDDRIENLIVLTRDKHVSLHSEKYPMVEYTCYGCGKKFERRPYRQKKSKRNFCSKSCFYDSSLKRSMTSKEYNRYFVDRKKRQEQIV